jgi:hypothetical protein
LEDLILEFSSRWEENNILKSSNTLSAAALLSLLALILLHSGCGLHSYDNYDIPVVEIGTYGTEITNERTEAYLIIRSSDYNYIGRILINQRGDLSDSYINKSFTIRTTDENYLEIDVPLLDLPEEKGWVLHSHYQDSSKIRNTMAYELYRKMGHYASRTVYVELMLNGNDLGIYSLNESISRDDFRVNISKLTPDEVTEPDIQGGYIIKITLSNDVDPDEEYFISSRGRIVLIDYPNYINNYQRNYIENYFNGFENSMAPENQIVNPDGWFEYLSFTELIDWIIINELAGESNPELYFYKDIGSRLRPGPIWDYDNEFGNSGNNFTGWFLLNKEFWSILTHGSLFRNELRIRWEDLRTNVLSDYNIINIYSMIEQTLSPVCDNCDGETLLYWIIKRAAWLDENISDY